jgi:hypothetical protein
MNYVEAAGHEKFLRRYREQVERFWSAEPGAPTERDIRERLPEVRTRFAALGMKETMWRKLSQDFTDLWGDYIADVLSVRTDRRPAVMATLVQMIGVAALNRRTARRRLLSPWCWPEDVAALIITFPVRVLHRAGMPEALDGEFWVRLIQALFTLALAAAGALLGIRALS